MGRDEEKAVRTAVAVQYDRGDPGLPRVLASGYGVIAERIIEIATEQGIPISEDATLSNLLAQFDAGSEIPQEAIVAMAEILSHIYRIESSMGTK